MSDKYSEAVFIPAICSTTGQRFFIREDIGDDDMWVRTYGLTSLPSEGRQAVSNKTINFDNERIGPSYKCPYCGKRHLVICRNCEVQACCYDGNSEYIYCHADGKKHKVGGPAASISGKAGNTQ